MSESPFDYDVFISFASTDETLVRPVWQHLTISGLRVFWSDSSLRESVGVSWFDVIQDAVGRSRHLVLVCTRASLDSKWVKREYVAFFNYHASPTRRLNPLLTPGIGPTDLPLFLRELEGLALGSSNDLRSLVRVLGGVDIEGLQRELARREEEIAVLRQEERMRPSLQHEVAQRDGEIVALQQEVRALTSQLSDALTQLQRAEAARPPISPNSSSPLTTKPEISRSDKALVSHVVSRAQHDTLSARIFGKGDDEISRFVRYISNKASLPVPLVVILLGGVVILILTVLQALDAFSVWLR